MFCLHCQKSLEKVIDINNIFKVSTQHICEACMTQSIVISLKKVIPIDSFLLEYNIIFDKIYERHPEAYMTFLKPYYIYFLKNRSNDIFIYLDTLTLETMKVLDRLKLGNIFLVTLYETKEEIYENRDYW